MRWIGRSRLFKLSKGSDTHTGAHGLQDMNAFYTIDELHELGVQTAGENVFVSRKASVYRPESIKLGNFVRIDDFCVLSGGTSITMGDYVHIACYCGLWGGSGISIGSHTTLSSRVVVYSESDDFSGASLTNPMVPKTYKPGYIAGEVNIGDHVVVGTNSTVLPGVSIADGVAVGAHSLIKEQCEAWSIYAGSPAKRLRARSKGLLDQLERFESDHGS